MANQTERKTQIKLGPAIGSYANLFKPRAINDKSEPKYSISLLFEKKAADKQLAELRKLIEFVAAEKFGPKWKAIPKFHNPIRDGDTEKPDKKEYAGRLFVNCSSKRQPGIVDRHLVPVTSENEAYSGCKFVASVNVFAFDNSGNKGVALGLNNILVFEKGEKLAGGKDAAEDFAEFVDDGKDSGGGGQESGGDEDPLS